MANFNGNWLRSRDKRYAVCKAANSLSIEFCPPFDSRSDKILLPQSVLLSDAESNHI